jgi:hypothetical protein
MGTFTARKALDDNLKRHVNPRQEPAMYNLCVALRAMTTVLDDLERQIAHVSKQVAQVATRQR